MNPEDPQSFNHCFASVNGVTIHYVDERRDKTSKGDENVIICVHGFPDLWFGWRNQIKYLTDLGYRVIVPDVRGYGQSSAPKATTTEELAKNYSAKTLATDLVKLLEHLEISLENNRSVVWLGHDWGGSFVWRAAMWYPEYVSAVISVCTPYSPTPPAPITLSQIVKKNPNWSYQQFFRTARAEVDLNNNKEIFFKSVFRYHTDLVRTSVFSFTAPIETRTITDAATKATLSPMISQRVLDYYVSGYSHSGFHGPLNCYKTHEINWKMEYDAGFVGKRLNIPCLMITASHDIALPPKFTKNMHKFIPNLTIKSVQGAGHWVLVEKSQEVNSHLGEFLTGGLKMKNKL